MKAKDIRELTDKEIVARIREDRELLTKMRFNHAITQIENPAKFKGVKKTIARLHTILKERGAAETAEKNNEADNQE